MISPCSVANKTIADSSENIDAQNMIDAVSKTKPWVHPKPFRVESEDIKITMILKWILGSGSTAYDGILNEKSKISNITVLLEKMKFNGYLRLFEVDMNILKKYMTESSWILFEDFKTKREKDTWKCPQCTTLFVQNTLKWNCDRCLFSYHEKCTKERKIKCKKNFGEDYSLCDSCFFAL